MVARLVFLMDYDRLSYIEAIEALAKEYGLTVPREAGNVESAEKVEDSKKLYVVLAAAAEFYQQQLRTHSNKEKAIGYLKSRGLSGQIAKQFGIGYAPSGWSNLQDHLKEHDKTLLVKAGLTIEKDNNKNYDRFRERIMFPIRDSRGRVVGFGGRIINPEDEPKYLNSPETPVFQKRLQLYGLYEVLQKRRAISKLLVVEGYMDVVALAQFGIHYAVATLGTATTPEHIQLLLRHTQHIVFCFDGDNAGRNAAWKALQVMLPFMDDNIRADFLFLPGEDDPDTLVRREGKTGFEQRLQEAPALSQYLLQHLSSAGNLHSLEGQAQFVSAAAPLIKQVPGLLLRYKLLEELAHQAKMNLAALSEMTGIALPKSEANKPFPRTQPKKQQPSLMQQVITLLLQHPELAQTVDNFSPWRDLDLPGSSIFCELLDLLEKNPNLTTGAMLEYWREQNEVFSHLQALAGREILLPETNLSAEFGAILQKLLQQAKQDELNNLQKKAEQNRLTETERQQYLTLLQKK